MAKVKAAPPLRLTFKDGAKTLAIVRDVGDWTYRGLRELIEKVYAEHAESHQ